MTPSLSVLERIIEQKEARIAVIGLGYVGLPVACMFATAGFDVLGVEIQPERVDNINAGNSPIEGKEPGLAEMLSRVVAAGSLKATTNYADLLDRDIILIDVETPVDENNVPRYRALRSALKQLAPVLKQGALVIIESTIAPGTMQNVVLAILEESGKKLNYDFFLGNCPERVMPGKLLSNLRLLSRVAGGMTSDTAQTMVSLYRHIVQADLDPVDCITAEIVKTAENAYRDVQIAFANELAMICQALGSDVWQVRQLVNKSPYRNMHLPGAGVGGHCIPKDPWLLVYGVNEVLAHQGKGTTPRLIPTARAVNDGMPQHVVNMVREALNFAGCALKGAHVLVMGYAYLEDSDDTRNSPSEVLVHQLAEMGVEVIIHDPYVADYKGDLFRMAEKADAVVLMVAHSDYKTLDLDDLKRVLRHPILVDGRGVFVERNLVDNGWYYHCLGKKAD